MALQIVALDGHRTGRQVGFHEKGHDLFALDEALQALASSIRERAVVQLRFFWRLRLEETAAALRVSVDTVKRDWRFAMLWLPCELEGHR